MERMEMPRIKGINDQGKRIERNTRITIISIIVFCVVGVPIILNIALDHYLKNDYGGFDSPEAVVMFYNEIPKENIADIIYGDDSACVCYFDNSKSKSHTYVYKNDNKWLSANTKLQTITNDEEENDYFITVVYIKNTGEYFVNIFFVNWETEKSSILISDIYNSEFNETPLSTKHALDYVAYLKPTKKEYVISIEGNEHIIELRHYK